MPAGRTCFRHCRFSRTCSLRALTRRPANKRKQDMTLGKWLAHSVFVFAVAMLAVPNGALAQEKGQMVRLSKLVIDPAHLEAYRSALKEEVIASMRLEPGVLTL